MNVSYLKHSILNRRTMEIEAEKQKEISKLGTGTMCASWQWENTRKFKTPWRVNNRSILTIVMQIRFFVVFLFRNLKCE